MSGLTTTGVTTRTTDGEFAVLPLLCPSEAVGSAAEASSSSQHCVSEAGVFAGPDSWRGQGGGRALRPPHSAQNVVSEAGVFAGPDSWRVEVAARLERYRTRRKPRTPRYPSLRLPFDEPESWSRPGPASGAGAIKTAVVLTEKEFGFQASAAPAETTDPDFAGPRRLS